MADNQSIKLLESKYIGKLNELKEIMESGEEFDYMIDSLYRIYSLLVENHQFKGLTVDEPIFGKKLIKCNRYIYNQLLDYERVDRVICGGLFIVVDVCLMPASRVRQSQYENKGYIIPHLYDLPTEKMVNYGTTKFVSDELAVAIMRNQWTDGWIDLASQYEYVTLGA